MGSIFEVLSRTEISVGVLEDSVLPDYKEFVLSRYHTQKARETLSKFASEGGELTGSNPFMLIALQESRFLGKRRLAIWQDLENVSREDLNIHGYRLADLGIAVRGETVLDKMNTVSAGDLFVQLRERGVNLGKGKLIPYSALTMREDGNSPYGLTLGLKKDAFLSHIHDLSYFTRLLTPKRNSVGRVTYGSDGGKSVDGADFGYSSVAGRVFVTPGEK